MEISHASIENTKEKHIHFLRRRQNNAKQAKRTIVFAIDKRQKFVVAVILLTIGLFLAEFQFGNYGFFIALILSLLTDFFVFWAMRSDLKENFTYSIFILPFFYSLSFGLFYFLVPARLIFRLILSLLYAFGLYSLFLSQNIFMVASIRTIALLSGARIVSFVITILSYFFLSNIIFSMHLPVIQTGILVFLYSYLLIYHAVWTYTLQKSLYPIPLWVFGLTLCLLESSLIIWFWPSNPTIIALFLSGFFYTIVGLSHVWFEKRLFRNVLWEYVWVCVVVFFVLIIFTTWGK